MKMKNINNKVWAKVAGYALCGTIIAGGMMSLAACSSDDNEVNNEGEECDIVFGAVVEDIQDKDTRSLFHNSTEFNTKGREILVCSYKYKDLVANPTAVFVNQVVTCTTEGEGKSATWTYSPTKYWDRQTNYHYLAQSPVTNTNSAGTDTYADFNTAADKMLVTIGQFPQWQNVNAATKDLMFATASGKYNPNAADNAFPDGYVSFNFYHALTQITVQAYTPDEAFNNLFRIKSIKFGKPGEGSQVPDGANSATCTYELAKATTGSKEEVWSDKTFANSYTAFTNSDGEALEYAEKHEDAQHITSNVAVPFNVSNGLALSVEYSYNGGTPQTVDIVLDGSEIAGSDPKAYMPTLKDLERGKNYVITLRFTTTLGEPIHVTVDVADWQDKDINHTIYNW